MKLFCGPKGFAILVSLTLLSLTGCGWWHSLPADWDKDIPGIYQGSYSNFVEIISFETNGYYHHTISQAGKTIVDEQGKWLVEPDSFSIELKPDGQFSLLYDPVKQGFSTNISSYQNMSFFPLPDGKTFFKISYCVDYRYCLIRQTKTNSAPR